MYLAKQSMNNLIYITLTDATSGSTSDYAYGAGGIPYSCTPELRGPGFNPGPEAIQPSFEEVRVPPVTM